VITGHTRLILHVGHPTHSFKSPLIYNPYFEASGIDVVVVPIDCGTDLWPALLRAALAADNVLGALVTMPLKVATVSLVDEVSTAVRIAGSCNAVRRGGDGRLFGDLFDGEGFVRGLARKGCVLNGARAQVLGCGGVGRAIAAALAGCGVTQIRLFDIDTSSMEDLADRLRRHFPGLIVLTGPAQPEDCSLLVNASPLGMDESDPLPIEPARIPRDCFVGDVVMRQTITPFLEAARARGCTIQVGTDMLFEQIPAYLEFFGLPTTTPDVLRGWARL
jgi:shikimate dehydrogenase